MACLQVKKNLQSSAVSSESYTCERRTRVDGSRLRSRLVSLLSKNQTTYHRQHDISFDRRVDEIINTNRNTGIISLILSGFYLKRFRHLQYPQHNPPAASATALVHSSYKLSHFLLPCACNQGGGRGPMICLRPPNPIPPPPLF